MERDYPSSSPSPFSYSPTGAAHTRQTSDYYSPSSRPPPAHDANHGPSDMDIVHEGGSNGSTGHGSYNNYGRSGEYEGDSYEAERDERYGRSEMQHMGSP
jgi:hypothetical protein